MDQKQRGGRLRSWPLPFLFLLLVIGIGNSMAQQGRGPALVIKGIAQYEDSALFSAAVGTLEEALKSPLDSRDSHVRFGRTLFASCIYFCDSIWH